MARYWSPTVEPPPLPRLERELINACSRFVVDRSFLVIEKRNRHYVKLRDGDVGRMLPQRNTGDTVTTLATLPAGQLQAGGRVVSHGASRPIAHLDTELSYPQLHLQHYVGRLGLISNSLLIADSTVLPASYRYPMIRAMTNPRIIDVNADFARLPDDLRPQRRLKGSYYHLDCWYSGHFGHVMSEVVSRLWGWHRVKQEFPDLKAIFRRRYPNERHPTLELALFTAFGIRREDIVWVDEPSGSRRW